MIPTTAQNTIANDLHRFRVLVCGRRFGKTTLAVEEIKGKVLYNPKNVTYFATTYQQARDIAWELLKKELAAAIISSNESRLEMKVRAKYGGVSLLQLRGWEAVEAERGKRNDFIVLDEVASMRNFWTGWNEVLRPTLTDTKGEGLFISTPSGYNHFYDLCNLELKDTDYKTFHFTTYDNPFIPVDEIDKAKRELSQEQFLQEYMASFQKIQGLVYKEFSRIKHLYDELPKRTFTKIAGIDFGYHQAAVIDIRTDGNDYFVEDEWYKSERTETQLAEYVAVSGFNPVYPDPESANGVEELRRKGINVREVAKGKDSVKHGIDKVREVLINGRLKINKKCVNLISEFEMYVYDEDSESDKPIKEHDHALDALRYAIMTHDFKPELQQAQQRQFEVMKARISQDSSR